jgi:hypothetical protein
VELTLAIIAINGWNRLAIGFRVPPDDSGRRATNSREQKDVGAV